MLILTAYREVLLRDPAIRSRAAGGIHLVQAPQDSIRPNIVLSLTGSGQDYSHQGPVGLMDAGVKVCCRADTVQAAGELAELVLDYLSTWRGTVLGCWVQLTEHENSASGFDDKMKVYTVDHEFTSHYRKVS